MLIKPRYRVPEGCRKRPSSWPTDSNTRTLRFSGGSCVPRLIDERGIKNSYEEKPGLGDGLAQCLQGHQEPGRRGTTSGAVCPSPGRGALERGVWCARRHPRDRRRAASSEELVACSVGDCVFRGFFSAYFLEEAFSKAALPSRLGSSLVLRHVPPASLPFIFPSCQPSRLPARAVSAWEPLKAAG